MFILKNTYFQVFLFVPIRSTFTGVYFFIAEQAFHGAASQKTGRIIFKICFMKKKSIRLQRLFLDKETIALLNKQQQEGIAGGATAGRACNSANCDTYDPQRTCESNPRPGYQCV